MKRILSIAGIFSLAILFLCSFSLRENPQDPPRGKKIEKRLKLVSVDEDGKKVELDTVIEGENVFVWKGDTIGGAKELKWISKGDFDMDDFEMDFDIDVEETTDGKVIIMKSGKDGKSIIREFKMDGEHGDHNVMMFHGDEGENEMIFHTPHIVGAPHASKLINIREHKSANVIDLSDPGIISYDKKELKDGKEKITIIRNKPLEEDIELHKEIIMHGAGDESMIIHKAHPSKTKTVKVIKGDDGNFTIYEDGKLTEIKEGEGKGAFITKEGNVYHVKTTKDGDKEKVEVKVEVKEEKKKENK